MTDTSKPLNVNEDDWDEVNFPLLFQNEQPKPQELPVHEIEQPSSPEPVQKKRHWAHVLPKKTTAAIALTGLFLSGHENKHRRGDEPATPLLAEAEPSGPEEPLAQITPVLLDKDGKPIRTFDKPFKIEDLPPKEFEDIIHLLKRDMFDNNNLLLTGKWLKKILQHLDKADRVITVNLNRDRPFAFADAWLAVVQAPGFQLDDKNDLSLGKKRNNVIIDVGPVTTIFLEKGHITIANDSGDKKQTITLQGFDRKKDNVIIMGSGKVKALDYSFKNIYLIGDSVPGLHFDARHIADGAQSYPFKDRMRVANIPLCKVSNYNSKWGNVAVGLRATVDEKLENVLDEDFFNLYASPQLPSNELIHYYSPESNFSFIKPTIEGQKTSIDTFFYPSFAASFVLEKDYQDIFSFDFNQMEQKIKEFPEVCEKKHGGRLFPKQDNEKEAASIIERRRKQEDGLQELLASIAPKHTNPLPRADHSARISNEGEMDFSTSSFVNYSPNHRRAFTKALRSPTAISDNEQNAVVTEFYKNPTQGAEKEPLAWIIEHTQKFDAPYSETGKLHSLTLPVIKPVTQSATLLLTQNLACSKITIAGKKLTLSDIGNHTLARIDLSAFDRLTIAENTKGNPTEIAFSGRCGFEDIDIKLHKPIFTMKNAKLDGDTRIILENTSSDSKPTLDLPDAFLNSMAIAHGSALIANDKGSIGFFPLKEIGGFDVCLDSQYLTKLTRVDERTKEWARKIKEAGYEQPLNTRIAEEILKKYVSCRVELQQR